MPNTGSPAAAGTPALIHALLAQPQAFPPPAAAVRLLETHISWVLLTGEYAYKIKKPVKFPFLDYSTLALRRAACEEELRLNRRFAFGLYLTVLPICGSTDAPKLGAGFGEPIEFAVQMREFPQSAQLDRRLTAGSLRAPLLEEFGVRLAGFHAAAAVACAPEEFGEPVLIHAMTRDNIADMLRDARPGGERETLAALGAWNERRFRQIEPVLVRRKRDGWVRECHGDLHLANLAEIDGRIVPFDCIEFSARLRWIDTISDAAFLGMDLEFRGRRDLAYRFLNAYLETTGDYGAMRVYRYYLVYRALVRAKVAMIRRGAAAAGAEEIAGHIELARIKAAPGTPAVILMHGYSGSGKSRIASELAQRLPAIQVRSDLERKRLHGLAALARSESPPAGGIYSPESNRRTLEALASAAEAIVAGGETAVLDATFLAAADRRRFSALAQHANVPFAIVDCHCERPELERRIAVRAQSQDDPSEADIAVLKRQVVQAEPLTADEQRRTLTVDTDKPLDLESIVRMLRGRV